MPTSDGGVAVITVVANLRQRLAPRTLAQMNMAFSLILDRSCLITNVTWFFDTYAVAAVLSQKFVQVSPYFFFIKKKFRLFSF